MEGYTYQCSLLRVGLLTDCYVNGFLNGSSEVVPSLPTMLKSSTDVLWPLRDWCSYMVEGALRLSLGLLSNVLADFPMYSSSQFDLLHLNQYITPNFCLIVSLSLYASKMFFKVLPLFKEVCIPYFLEMILMFLHRPSGYCITMCLCTYLLVLCCSGCL